MKIFLLAVLLAGLGIYYFHPHPFASQLENLPILSTNDAPTREELAQVKRELAETTEKLAVAQKQLAALPAAAAPKATPRDVTPDWFKQKLDAPASGLDTPALGMTPPQSSSSRGRGR